LKIFQRKVVCINIYLHISSFGMVSWCWENKWKYTTPPGIIHFSWCTYLGEGFPDRMGSWPM